MSILLNRETKALIQGITGRVGQSQTRWMLEYGTNIVAGVTPGKGGWVVEGIPVYDTVAEAVAEQMAERQHSANVDVQQFVIRREGCVQKRGRMYRTLPLPPKFQRLVLPLNTP